MVGGGMATRNSQGGRSRKLRDRLNHKAERVTGSGARGNRKWGQAMNKPPLPVSCGTLLQRGSVSSERFHYSSPTVTPTGHQAVI